MTSDPTTRCWICESAQLVVAKPADLECELDPQAFAITDSHYGRTAEIQRCLDCGFLQCSDMGDLVGMYEALEDQEYEDTRKERALQMKRLLDRIARDKPAGRLLDVGAGSGILVEEAIARGYKASGVEPSEWLQKQACRHGLPVHLGTLPLPELEGPYEVVTLVDVLEHVTDPIALLEQSRRVLAPDGLLAIVTPDVGSLLARWLGWRWWHFRVAHVGYFDRSTLERALDRAGLELLRLGRPTWYFGADYLTERVLAYLPRWLRFPVPGFLRRVTVPLNLGDSFFALARARRA
jgi:SAM-dependent methyltransferase